LLDFSIRCEPVDLLLSVMSVPGTTAAVLSVTLPWSVAARRRKLNLAPGLEYLAELNALRIRVQRMGFGMGSQLAGCFEELQIAPGAARLTR
jgi:hypothetical protein